MDRWSRPAFHVADFRAASADQAGEAEHVRGEGVTAKARISQPAVIVALLLFDQVNFFATGLLSYLSVIEPADFDWRFFGPGALLVAVVGGFVLKSRWTYTIRALGNFPRQSLSLAIALILALAAWDAGCILVGVGEPQLASLRLWTLHWFIWGWGGGAMGRALFAFLVTRWTAQGRLSRRTVIVGGGAQAVETIRRLEKSGKGALQILGLFDDRDRSRLPPDLGGYQLLGAFADLEAFCRNQKVDLLIVAFPLSAEDRILYILNKLWVLPVDVRISALGSKLTLRDRAYNYIGDVPFLPVFDKPMSDWAIAQKTLFDRVLSLILLIVLSPVLAIVALGVKLSSPGPVLFVQKRYGFNNEQFGALKFRSMYQEGCDANANQLVTRGDPRVTKFGAFLRRSSLDELPQLFNVLKGDLSLVGPRPHALKAKAAGMIYEKAVEGYFARHRVKPGITGWAQINGWRGETDTTEKIEQRVAHDLFYIDNWSLWLDIKILLKTPIAVLFQKNAF
jgi:Undecaprenyl-phosphate glucose phosphotransferase